MKKIIVWVCLSFFFMTPSFLYGMSALEEEYKQQMEVYNIRLRSAEFNISFAQTQIEHVREVIQLCGKHNLERAAEGTKLEDCDSKYGPKLNKAENDYKDYRKQKNEISDKKSDLKIRVIEKLGRLPKWWK